MMHQDHIVPCGCFTHGSDSAFSLTFWTSLRLVSSSTCNVVPPSVVVITAMTTDRDRTRAALRAPALTLALRVKLHLLRNHPHYLRIKGNKHGNWRKKMMKIIRQWIDPRPVHLRMSRKQTRIHATRSSASNRCKADKTSLTLPASEEKEEEKIVEQDQGRSLVFLTIEFSHRARTFNLNRLDDIQSHLNRAYPQSSTMQSLRFALAYITFQPPKSRNWRQIVYISKTQKPNGKYDIGWNRSYAPQDYIAFKFDDIINLVALDFAHSHFTLGDAVFVQKDGCPIGGYLSSPSLK
eukprot:g66338.t1